MPRYSDERKAAVLSKLLPPHNQPVPLVASTEGISEATLCNWLHRVRDQGVPVPGSKAANGEQWNGNAKFAAVVETQAMNDVELSAYCREKGLYPEQIARWREACVSGAETGVDASKHSESLKHARNKIKRLERQIDRKDKALAESAALLVLSKKFQALWEDEEK